MAFLRRWQVRILSTLTHGLMAGLLLGACLVYAVEGRWFEFSLTLIGAIGWMLLWLRDITGMQPRRVLWN